MAHLKKNNNNDVSYSRAVVEAQVGAYQTIDQEVPSLITTKSLGFSSLLFPVSINQCCVFKQVPFWRCVTPNFLLSNKKWRLMGSQGAQLSIFPRKNRMCCTSWRGLLILRVTARERMRRENFPATCGIWTHDLLFTSRATVQQLPPKKSPFQSAQMGLEQQAASN